MIWLIAVAVYVIGIIFLSPPTYYYFLTKTVAKYPHQNRVPNGADKDAAFFKALPMVLGWPISFPVLLGFIASMKIWERLGWDFKSGDDLEVLVAKRRTRKWTKGKE